MSYQVDGASKMLPIMPTSGVALTNVVMIAEPPDAKDTAPSQNCDDIDGTPLPYFSFPDTTSVPSTVVEMLLLPMVMPEVWDDVDPINT